MVMYYKGYYVCRDYNFIPLTFFDIIGTNLYCFTINVPGIYYFKQI